jgi:hypothetical protein
VRQIIEQSESYKPPETSDELYAMNDERRAAAKREYERERKRFEADVLPQLPAKLQRQPGEETPEEADARIAAADAHHMEEMNRQLALAGDAA